MGHRTDEGIPISPCKMLIYIFLQLQHLLFCHNCLSQQLASLPLQILLGAEIARREQEVIRECFVGSTGLVLTLHSEVVIKSEATEFLMHASSSPEISGH